LTRPPEPPDDIANWLEAGWDNPSEEIVFRESQAESDPSEARALRGLKTTRQETWRCKRWKLSRDEWAKSERPARAAMKIFEDAVRLYGRIEREAERVELVLGDGILSCGGLRETFTTRFCCSACNCNSMQLCQSSRFPKLIILLSCIRHSFKP